MAEIGAPRGTSLDELCVNAIRVLSMDAVQKANSGHPGTPMALAPLAYVLWTKHLRHDPADPSWPGRDRFVLSCGHASMLLYSLLHLCGYDLLLDELKQFRQWESRTPGHPEYGMTPGVETTTGPLGQGFGNAVGMAIAESSLAAVFSREISPLSHHTYFIASDGDLMEGISHEAASLAGHLRLSRLVGFYDDNHITIEGETKLAFSDDTSKRFEGYGWRVLRVEDGNDLAALDRIITTARGPSDRPTLVIVRTHIAFGSPNKHDSAEAHGAPLGAEEVLLTKQNLGWPSLEPFEVPEAAVREWRRCRERGAALHAEWEKGLASYRVAHPAEARELERRLRGELPSDWESALPTFTSTDGSVATRAASGRVLNAIAPKLPELMGGSADLAPSTNTLLKGSPDFEAGSYAGRNFHFGIREHGMGAALNGMALHGGVIPYGATFLIFSDYMRPAIRLASLMRLHVIYVFTHDSIGLGEDGPTHQPVESLAALRVIPNLTVIRPADSSETVEAWRVAVRHREGPVALVLTRQKVPFLDRSRYAAAAGVARGAYVLSEADGGAPQVILIASGSEVGLVMAAQEKLKDLGVAARVVSAPCLELFAAQPSEYRHAVLPHGVRLRLAVEAAHPLPWRPWVGDEGAVLGIERFGASAPAEKLFEAYGLTVENVVARAQGLLGGTR